MYSGGSKPFFIVAEGPRLVAGRQRRF